MEHDSPPLKLFGQDKREDTPSDSRLLVGEVAFGLVLLDLPQLHG